MGRLDTAGFFKNLAFHGHSKKKLVPLDNDDYGNPTDPCDKCPEGYECDNGECIPVGPGPIPIPGPGQKIDPEPIDPENPTEQTQCKKYSSIGNGIKYTENNTWTGYDANSGAHWTFKCAEKLTFYGRLNHSASSGLVNDIRWGVGNHVRSFIVPENESLEQSIFRFNVNVDGTYLIEIKKKASGDYYYPWEVWEAGKLPEADGKTLYMGVSALAEIWGETIQFPDEIVVLYEGAGGKIIHNKTRREVTLTRSNGEELTIMDRNLGATAYYGESGASTADTYGNYYQRGNNHPFTASGNQFTTTQTDTTGYSYNNPFSSNLFYTSTEDNYGMATHQDWANPHNNSLWGSGGSEITRQGPCADGWHIPNSLEMSDLFRMWGQITGIDIQENFNVNKLNQFCRNTLTPKAGLIRFTGGAPGYTEDTAFYWTTSVTRYNESNDSAYRGYASNYGLFVQPEGTASRIPAKCYGHPIRPFKNKTDVPKYTITFVNYDGTVLQSSRVYSGLLPQYRGETPTKPSDQQYSYTFSGWSPEITTVSGDQTYTAQYTAVQTIMEGDYDLRLPQWQDLDTLFNEGLVLRFYSGDIPRDNSYDFSKSYFRIGNFFYYIVQKTQDKSSAESWGEGYGVYFDEPSGYYIVYSLNSYRQVSFDSVLGGYYQEYDYEKHGEVKRPLYMVKRIPANTLNFNHFLVRVEYKTGGTYFTESGLDFDGITHSYGYPSTHAYYVYTSSDNRKVRIGTRSTSTSVTYSVTSDIYGFEIEGNISEGTLTIKRLGQDGSVIGTLNTSSYKDTFLNTVRVMRDENGISLRFWAYLTMQPEEMEEYGFGLEHTNKRLKYLFE